MTATALPDLSFNPWTHGRDELLSGDAVDRQGSVAPEAPPGFVTVVVLERHKYDGVLQLPGQQYHMAEERVTANEERGLVKRAHPVACDWWSAKGRILAAEPCDAEPYATIETPGALRIVSGCGFDPGNAAFRFHSALNETTKHASTFVRWGHSNPYCDLRQLDGDQDAGAVRDAVMTADVIHCHVQYFLLNNVGVHPRPDQLLIRHYHGSAPEGRTNLEPTLDLAQGAKLLGARLSLIAEAKVKGMQMEWCPIPIPVARYRAMRDALTLPPLDGVATPQRPLRIAHSPTAQHLKGSQSLALSVGLLKTLGVPVELVLIQNTPMAEALALKATCDVCFDSFWLGIQGSGLEAAAMGLPVIAGDADVVALYGEEIGHVPYTVALDGPALTRVLEQMAMDPAYRAAEAGRVGQYVADVHDYAAVAARYERTLSVWLGRPDVQTDERTPTNTQAPAPTVHAPPVPQNGTAPKPVTLPGRKLKHRHGGRR